MFIREVVEEKAAVLLLSQIIVQRQSGLLKDAEALTAPSAFEIWAPDMSYSAEQIISHEGSLYRVKQNISQSVAHQPPGASGMLAVYSPIVRGHDGTQADPIPYIYGMDCRAGKYYIFEDTLYLCAADMIPCTWPPGSPGVWQWQ